MRRVLILGCPASGKSTLARQLADATSLPLLHLDQIYWMPGWVEMTERLWQQRLQTELAKPAWIMDGHYGGTLAQRLAQADTAILLDLPTRICLWRALRRLAMYWGRSRPEVPAGCPEQVNLAFLRYILIFRRQKRADLLNELERFHGSTFILRSPHDVRTFVDSLQPATAAAVTST